MHTGAELLTHLIGTKQKLDLRLLCLPWIFPSVSLIPGMQVCVQLQDEGPYLLQDALIPEVRGKNGHRIQSVWMRS